MDDHRNSQLSTIVHGSSWQEGADTHTRRALFAKRKAASRQRSAPAAVVTTIWYDQLERDPRYLVRDRSPAQGAGESASGTPSVLDLYHLPHSRHIFLAHHPSYKISIRFSIRSSISDHLPD